MFPSVPGAAAVHTTETYQPCLCNCSRKDSIILGLRGWGGVYKGSVKVHWVDLLALLCQCGNFVMQHLMEHGSSEQKALVLSALHADLKKAALHTHAVAVLDAALRFAALPDACELARQLLRVEQLLPWLATVQRGQRRGQDAVQRLLYVVDDQLLMSAALQLHDLRDSLRSSSGGRSIFKVISH